MKSAPQSFAENFVGLAFVFGSILFTVYGQLIVKWQVNKAGALPVSLGDKAIFLMNLILNPWIMSGIAAGFGALICWLAAMTKFELSYAYPFMSLAFVVVLVLSVYFFNENLTTAKVMGVLLVMAGIAVASRG